MYSFLIYSTYWLTPDLKMKSKIFEDVCLRSFKSCSIKSIANLLLDYKIQKLKMCYIFVTRYVINHKYVINLWFILFSDDLNRHLKKSNYIFLIIVQYMDCLNYSFLSKYKIIDYWIFFQTCKIQESLIWPFY